MAVSPLLSAMVAELVRSGAIGVDGLENMQRRLTENGHQDEADEIGRILLSEVMDAPEVRRATIHSINGGNTD